MSAIHLIKKNDKGLPDIVPVRPGENLYESGCWYVTKERARALICGDPSFHGGEILSMRPVGDRIAFQFTYRDDCKGVKAPIKGWLEEMKFVY
jgi:hypothetical protein